ncbi:MAG: hypothetical protein GX130_06175, partial [Candidatus Hydrogenedens sp.]|nr:hypothetical protein [Candidatus Hydrogenedens sp.]
MKKLTLTPQQKQWVKTNLFRPSFLLLSGLTEEEIEARLFSGIQAGELRRNFTKADLKVWIHREFISQIKTVPGDARDFFVPPNLEELVDTAREYFNTPPGDIA